MARRRRSSGSRKKSRGWLWLVFGLALGVAVMYGAQRFVYKDRKPFGSLAGLFSPETKPAGKSEETGPRPEGQRPSRPKLDFYTILPGETLLPEPKPDRDRKAKTEVREKGVRYVLQAAAYANADDADRLKAKLALNGLEAHIEKVMVGDRGAHYRVRLGPYSKIDDLDAANDRLSQLGIKAMRLRVQKAPRT